MKFFVAFACVILSAYGYVGDSSEHGVSSTGVSPNCTCGTANKGGSRIVNGRTTKLFEYPMLAGMVHKRMGMIVCGGALVTNKHVVTAAHCLKDSRASDFMIHTGSYSYSHAREGNTNEVERFDIHPAYNHRQITYDIGVITVVGTFKLGATVVPVCLPSRRINLVGEHLKVLGWGRLSSGGKSAPFLLQTYLQVREHEFCHSANRGMEMRDRHQICTYTRGTDACQGDSGGPLLWRNPATNRYTLAAVVSYGVDCAVYPAVNTEVAVFVPWIQSVISRTRTATRTCAHN